MSEVPVFTCLCPWAAILSQDPPEWTTEQTLHSFLPAFQIQVNLFSEL
jgi:hypothetical protein